MVHIVLKSFAETKVAVTFVYNKVILFFHDNDDNYNNNKYEHSSLSSYICFTLNVHFIFEHKKYTICFDVSLYIFLSLEMTIP